VSQDAVRDLLRRRGAPEHLVEGGLAGLVAEWEKTAQSVATGYPLGLDDYLNDMDLRQLLNDALDCANDIARLRVLERLTRADDLLRAHSVPMQRCLWGEAVARYHGWEPERSWWYFRQPRDPGPELAEDLEGR